MRRKYIRKLFLILSVICLLAALFACSNDDSYLLGDMYETAAPLTQPTREELTETEPAESDSAESVSTESSLLSAFPGEEQIAREGSYTTMEDVSLYLHTYGELPDNFMTKNSARELGWEGGSLEPYAPGMCIGGDYFGNYEGLLPISPGREYRECDINTLGANSRGAERIIYSNDGLIYYTADHYESFTLLYGQE